jgi:uncharacterized protein Yka (UPF0111/DUF47 family)
MINISIFVYPTNNFNMPVFARTTKNVILKIDEFFDNIDLGLLVFKEAIRAFLEKDMEAFLRHLKKVDSLESNADKLQRSIENEMITHSILAQGGCKRTY